MKLTLQAVRILESADLVLGENLNVIRGSNGSGKSSILEGIHILARGKSFRTPRIREVIRREKDFILVAATINVDGNTVQTGVQRDANKTLMKFQGEHVRSLSGQARNIPLLIQTPESTSMLIGLPRERRRWLDWLMFHVEPGYLDLWNQFQKSLRQRNSLLRADVSDHQFLPWESAMHDSCELIQHAVENALSNLKTEMEDSLSIYLKADVELKYLRGWNSEGSYLDYLHSQRDQHRECGFTSGGPQRSDVGFFVDGIPVAKVLSRGQTKLFLLALCLAEANLIEKAVSRRPILLLDDICSELDEQHTKKVIQDLKSRPFQCILTTTQDVEPDTNIRVFHVEQGSVQQL